MTRAARLALLASPLTLGTTAGVVALPPAQHALLLPAVDGSILVAFSLGVALGMPIGGRLMQVHGGRRALYVATAATVAGAVLILAGPDRDLVLLGRFLLGLGSGGLTTVGFAGAGRHDRPNVAFAGISAAMNGLAGAGALVGAGLAGSLGWRAALALPAIAVLAVPAELRAYPSGHHRSGIAFDAVGMVLLGVTVVGAVVAIDSPSAGFGGTAAVAALVVAVLAAVATVWWARRKRERGFVPVGALGNAQYRGAIATGPWFMAANFSTLFLVPWLLTHGGASGTEVGLLLLPAAVVAGAAGALATAVSRARRGPAVIGAVGVAAAIVIVAAALTAHPVLLAAAAAAALGATALSQGTLSNSAVATLQSDEVPGALGLFNLALQVGGAAGVAGVAFLLAASPTLALAAAGGLAVVGGLASVFLVRRTHGLAAGPQPTRRPNPPADVPVAQRSHAPDPTA